jgi:signal transduction histidine kinase
MESEFCPETEGANAALAAWRGKAYDVLLAASAVLNTPMVLLMALGLGPPMGAVVKAFAIEAYAVMAGAAVLRWTGRRVGLWVYFAGMYPAVAVANIALPLGPYAMLGLFFLPVVALVLAGTRASIAAVLANAAILISAPLLRSLPGVARFFELGPTPASPSTLTWAQVAVQMCMLIGAIILLESFQRFLSEALAAEQRAKAAQEHEARERHRLERQIADTSDEERRLLGHDLHDGVCQQLTAALLRCQALELRVDRGGTVAVEDFQTLSALLGETMDETRKVAVGLWPLDPDPESLAPALRALIQRTQDLGHARAEFRATGDVRVPDPAVAHHLYRIAQEAVSNAARHSGASRIALELRGSTGELILQVEDDGAGLPSELLAGGMGLRTMAYRARILNGEIAFKSRPGGGTRVTCRAPRTGTGRSFSASI